MYKHSDRMWFNEDESYIQSLSKCSEKRVVRVCPICEEEKSVLFTDVNKRKSTLCKSCSRKISNFLEVVDKKFGRLLVVSMAFSKNGKQHVNCRCDCGKTVIVGIAELKTNSTRSCGCLLTDLFSVWRGPLHPNYDHSITEEQRALSVKKRRNAEARRWHKEVLERDENACTICDAVDGLVAHHLNGFKDNESLRYDVDNGVTLCWSCHNSFHQNFMGGYKIPCTLQDFEDFLYQI